MCGSNLACIKGAESCPGTRRVHRWFTASCEYADMNIQEETVNPKEQGHQHATPAQTNKDNQAMVQATLHSDYTTVIIHYYSQSMIMK